MNHKRPLFWIGSAFVGLFVAIFLLPLAASPTRIGGVLRCMPLGWWHFLHRNIPQMTYNWDLLASGLVYSALVVVVGKSLLQVLFTCSGFTCADSRLRHWAWRWTFCLYAGVWLLFMIAFGACGLIRHINWLADYRQPWYEPSMNSFLELRVAQSTVEQLLLENNEDLNGTRKMLQAQRCYRHATALLPDEFDTILYADESNRVAAYVIIPRKSQVTSKGEFATSTGENYASILPMADLQGTIAKLDARYRRSNPH